MPTSRISNTIKDLNGTGIAGVTVIARLRPGPAFRIDDNTEVAAEERTTTDASGFWQLELEQNANVTPVGNYYALEEQIPESGGGGRVWAILVGSIDSSLSGARVSPPPEPVTADHLTQSVADGLYAGRVDGERNRVARRLYLRTTFQ